MFNNIKIILILVHILQCFEPTKILEQKTINKETLFLVSDMTWQSALNPCSKKSPICWKCRRMLHAHNPCLAENLGTLPTQWLPLIIPNSFLLFPFLLQPLLLVSLGWCYTPSHIKWILQRQACPRLISLTFHRCHQLAFTCRNVSNQLPWGLRFLKHIARVLSSFKQVAAIAMKTIRLTQN